MRRPAEPPRRKQACAAKAIYRKLNGKEAIFAFSADFDRCLVWSSEFPGFSVRNISELCFYSRFFQTYIPTYSRYTTESISLLHRDYANNSRDLTFLPRNSAEAPHAYKSAGKNENKKHEMQSV